MHFFSSIEFCVIMAVIAAAIVAMAARPQTRTELREYLLGSRLGTETSGGMDEVQPAIEFRCLDDGHVLLVRQGLEHVTASGAVSIAATFDGMDLRIEERLTEGSQWDTPVTEAVFDIDFLPPGRYHVTYNSQRTGRFVSMHLHVRPGLVATRDLTQ